MKDLRLSYTSFSPSSDYQIEFMSAVGFLASDEVFFFKLISQSGFSSLCCLRWEEQEQQLQNLIVQMIESWRMLKSVANEFETKMFLVWVPFFRERESNSFSPLPLTSFFHHIE